jgi:hypothetical protein
MALCQFQAGHDCVTISASLAAYRKGFRPLKISLNQVLGKIWSIDVFSRRTVSINCLLYFGWYTNQTPLERERETDRIDGVYG